MSVWRELKRRNVMRVAALYIVSAWLILQVVDVVAPILALPDWFARGVLLILALGFVPTLVFSWVYEITPEGIKRESTVERSESTTAATARKLDLAVIVLLLLAMGMFALDRFVTTAPDPASVEGASEEAQLAAPATTKPALDAATQDSIAVLPFTDLSPAGDQAYFADGIAEELLNTLVRIPDLKVAARTSSFRFRESDRDIADIAKQLGVATVLEGSVRKSGDNIRITAQLIDAETGFHLWSESYDESVSDVFEIQNRIARQIATALKVQLEAQAAASRPANQAAFHALLEGRHLFAERHQGSNRYDGIAQFALATELDPGYADAWAYYAYSLSVSGPEEMGLSFEEKHRRVDAAAERALALEPDHPLALTVQGARRTEQFSFEEGLEILLGVTEKYPSMVEGQYALAGAWEVVGNYARSVQVMRRVLALDPLNPTRFRVYTQRLFLSGRVSEAMDNVAELLSLGSDFRPIAIMHWWLALIRREAEWRPVRDKLLEQLAASNTPSDIAGNIEQVSDDLSALLGGQPGELERLPMGQDRVVRPVELLYINTLMAIREVDLATDLIIQMIDDGSLLSTGVSPLFLSPVFRLDEEVLNHPAYVAMWQRPEMLKLARARTKYGTSHAIPPEIIAQVSVE